MAEHDHGSMDIKDHEKTFSGFISFTTKTVIACVVLAVFLAIFAS